MSSSLTARTGSAASAGTAKSSRQASRAGCKRMGKLRRKDWSLGQRRHAGVKVPCGPGSSMRARLRVEGALAALVAIVGEGARVQRTVGHVPSEGVHATAAAALRMQPHHATGEVVGQ